MLRLQKCGRGFLYPCLKFKRLRFTDYIKSEDVERLYVTYSESRVNLGIHYYRNKLYTSNLVGICRIKSVDDETLYDAEGNELLIKVIPRFNVKIVELLNYMRDDDEFDRYMAPQTISNRHKERDIEAIDRNEIFYFYGKRLNFRHGYKNPRPHFCNRSTLIIHI